MRRRILRPAKSLLASVACSAGARRSVKPLTIAKTDYDAYQQLLGDIQAAFSAEDLNALRAKVTPEMLSYFAEQLAENSSRGLINRVADVKLLQGDLAEAWSEGNADYATVAMRFALKDSMVERNSGRIVEGGGVGRSHRNLDIHARPAGNMATVGRPTSVDVE